MLDKSVEERLAVFLGFMAKWRCPMDTNSFRVLVGKLLGKLGIQEPRFKDNIPGEGLVRLFMERNDVVLRFAEKLKTARTSVYA